MPSADYQRRTRVTINDVAAAAGVSRGAVTRALNNKADISGDTKQKVLEAAERLGYRPSRFARSFVARSKARGIGLALKSFGNPFYTELASELLAQAREKGWQVVITSSEGVSEEETLQSLIGQVDVVAGHFNLPPESLKLATQGMPIILLEGPSQIPGIHSVGLDMRAGMKEAVETLYAHGAKRIGMIDSDYSVMLNGVYTPSPRCEFFLENVREDTRDATVCAPETLAGGEYGLNKLLSLRADLDAVVVFNDFMAIGAMYGAFRSGHAVPEQVRILGIDGLLMGQALSPALSSLEINRKAMVSELLDIAEVLRQSDFREMPALNRRVGLKLIMRQST